MSTQIVITNAGYAEIVNAEKNGTAPVVLSQIALGTGQYTATADMTALKSEIKRLDAISGGAAGDNVIHLSAEDSSADVYNAFEVGIFTESGTLFAVYSQNTAIISKSASSIGLLAIDIVLGEMNPESITVGDTQFIINPATTERKGVIEIATETEAKGKTDTERAITPATLDKAIEAHGNIVHRSGEETIAGKKLFKSALYKVSSQVDRETTPSANIWDAAFVIYDKNSKTFFNLQAVQDTAGQNQVRMVVFDKNSSENQILSLGINSGGTPYATAPTPATGDNSTKIATTAWVTAKAKEYLPLAGGKMTSNNAILRSVDNEYISIFGGSSSGSGAQLDLCGKDHASIPSAFQLHARNNSVDKILVGEIDGDLKWDGKHIVRSVNGVLANNAGNVTITALNVNALPLSGGAMTATKAMTRDVANSFLGLHGGTGNNNDGAQLYLCGANHPDMPGMFQLHARNSEKTVTLQGDLDGKLIWNDKYVLNNSFQMPTDGGAIMLTAGTSSTGGAYFRLYGKNHSSGAGQFNIAATDGTSTKALVGKPDGTLTWDGKPLVFVETWQANDGSGWYRKYSDGWVEQGGVIAPVDHGNGSEITATLFVEMKNSNYHVDATVQSAEVDDILVWMVTERNQTNVVFSADVFFTQSSTAKNRGLIWKVSGYSA